MSRQEGIDDRGAQSSPPNGWASWATGKFSFDEASMMFQCPNGDGKAPRFIADELNSMLAAYNRLSSERDAALAERDTQRGRADYSEQHAGRLLAERDRLREALVEIEKGAGPFSLDRMKFAENCIENMKAIARAALTPSPAQGKTGGVA